MVDLGDEIRSDVAAVERVRAVPTILSVVRDVTGMGFTAVARVTDIQWVACAVSDGIGFGLGAGEELPLHSTLCYEVRCSSTPIVICDAAIDPVYKDHHTPRIYSIRSYVSVPIIRSDGRYFGTLCAIDPNPANVGSPRILAIFTKFARLIGESLDFDQSLVEAQDELRSERERSALCEEFTAILGHDLRNPLAGIVSWADVVQRCANEPIVQRAGERIAASADRMRALIDNTLDLARGRLRGGIEARLALTDDLAAGLAGVVAELEQKYPDRIIHNHIKLGKRLVCDESRIHQLASNLLGNALHHGDPSGAVQFSARAQDGMLTIDVWNSGPPIPSDNIASVLKPFWRGASQGDRRHGLGLGLYICDMIVKSHGGTLQVSSSKESGTTFTVHIPLYPRAAS
jgi:signal transduction histidine kinase